MGSQLKKIIVAVLLVAAALAGLGAWGWHEFRRSQSKKEQISIGAIAYDKNALIYIAEDQKYFAENGIEVTLKNFDTGSAALEAMLAGKIGIAAASEFAVVGKSLRKPGDKFRIFATIAKTQDDYIFGRRDRGIGSFSDLKGKRVGLKKETAAEFYLGRFLDTKGLSLRQVTVVDIDPTQSVRQFAEGDLDAIVIWQPYAYRIRAGLADRIVSWSAQNGQLMYWNMIATDAWLSAHPELATRVVRALVQAEHFLAQHPAQARAIVQRWLGYDDACINAIWPDSQFSVSLDQSLIVAMEDEARWMIANGLTGEKDIPDYLDDYIHKNSLSTVRPEIVNIIR